MSLPQIIGLNGVARAGKDTVAQILHDLYGYEPVSFSDMLNEALIALNPWVDILPSAEGFSTGGYGRYADLVDGIGYERAKEQPEVRRLLQAMGTEVGRNLLGADIWVDALFKNLPKGLVAITNVRFPNEYDATVHAGGVNWRVLRPGFTAANGHISDTALDQHIFDQHIENNGTKHDLAQKVIEAVTWHQRDSSANLAHNEGVRAGA